MMITLEFPSTISICMRYHPQKTKLPLSYMQIAWALDGCFLHQKGCQRIWKIIYIEWTTGINPEANKLHADCDTYENKTLY